MTIHMQTLNFSIKSSLTEFINTRLSKFPTFHSRIISSEIYLKLENISEKENKRVEIRVKLPGDDLIIKKQRRTFEEAIDACSTAMERMLITRKEKSRTHG